MAMTTTKDVYSFTVETMAQHIKDLVPVAEIEVDGQTITAKIEGVGVYLRLQAGALQAGATGLGWSVDAMGPSMWGESEPDESVQQFCVTRIEEIAEAVDWIADHAWAKHAAAS